MGGNSQARDTAVRLSAMRARSYSCPLNRRCTVPPAKAATNCVQWWMPKPGTLT